MSEEQTTILVAVGEDFLGDPKVLGAYARIEVIEELYSALFNPGDPIGEPGEYHWVGWYEGGHIEVYEVPLVT